MKIAFFSDTFFPTKNGVVSSIENLSVGLSRLGHKVLVVAPSDPRLEGEKLGLPAGVEVLWQPSVNGRFYPDFRLGLPTVGVYKKLKQFGPDVIHSFTPGVFGLEAIVLSRRLAVPVVFSHTTKFEDERVLRAVRFFSVKLLGGLHRRSVGSLIKKFIQLNDRVVVSTRDTNEWLTSLGVSVPIDVVPFPVPVEELKRGKSEGMSLREKLGVSQGLIYVGRLSREKNLDKLVKVFSMLVGDFARLKLVLVGNGPAREELFLQTADLGVSERVVWVGEVAYRDLVRKGYFYLGDVFMSLSEFETQGLSVVEAMACGLAVVVVENTPMAEIVDEEKLQVDLEDLDLVADKVRGLLRRRKFRELVVKEGLKRVDKYSIDNCTKGMVGVYKSLL